MSPWLTLLCPSVYHQWLWTHSSSQHCWNEILKTQDNLPSIHNTWRGEVPCWPHAQGSQAGCQEAWSCTPGGACPQCWLGRCDLARRCVAAWSYDGTPCTWVIGTGHPLTVTGQVLPTITAEHNITCIGELLFVNFSNMDRPGPSFDQHLAVSPLPGDIVIAHTFSWRGRGCSRGTWGGPDVIYFNSFKENIPFNLPIYC